eukprot:GHVS01009498.1.p2 GENE.GHVS01009498.1~~GHVS01009498.1.p2  ORF type:complete len:180 (+),score=61.41 GHVS01009498.1:64-540(+)
MPPPPPLQPPPLLLLPVVVPGVCSPGEGNTVSMVSHLPVPSEKIGMKTCDFVGVSGQQLKQLLARCWQQSLRQVRQESWHHWTSADTEGAEEEEEGEEEEKEGEELIGCWLPPMLLTKGEHIPVPSINCTVWKYPSLHEMQFVSRPVQQSDRQAKQLL